MEERFDYDGLLEVNANLREQNRVLADERDKLNIAIGQAIVTLRYYAKTAISVRAVDTLERIEAAITATSQEGQHG